MVDKELFDRDQDRQVKNDTQKVGNLKLIDRRNDVLENFKEANEDTIIEAIDNEQSMPTMIKKKMKKMQKIQDEEQKKKKKKRHKDK